MLMPHELIVDNFAGGGGASTGIEAALGRPIDIAINHDPEAIAMHKRNHPRTLHLCENVWNVDIVAVTKGRPVGIAWFSPDCKHHSRAKGGKPLDNNIRGLAWVVIKWAELKRPRVICLENVGEWLDWCPLLDNNMPDPARKGLTFRRWAGRLRNLNYHLEWRVDMSACDYGAPTIRKRLVLVARCDGQPVHWPEKTHGPGLLPYRAAAECIDWERPCPSIFLSREEGRAQGCNRPLADATMRRIARGVKRYVLDAAEPFIVGVGGRMGQSAPRGVFTQSFQTVTSKGDSALVTPLLASLTHHGEDRCEDIVEPFRTITGAHRGEKALVLPFLETYYGANREGGERVASIEEPLRTQSTENRFGLASAFLAQHNTGATGHDARSPLSTVTQRGTNQQLVTAFLSRQFGKSVGSAATEPVGTTTAGGGGKSSLIAASMMKMRGTNTGSAMNEPLHTLSAGGTHQAAVYAFLMKYYGVDQAPELTDPMHTVPTKDRFALCIVWIQGCPYVITDIGMRMLTPRELFRAQGFPDSYIIDADGLTKTAQVRMCGNSVCPDVAEAVVRAQFGGGARRIAA